MADREEYDIPPRDWDEDRKMKWIRTNEKMIFSAIQSFRRQYDIEDLRQTAYEATLQAFRFFDPSRGVGLGTYVFRSIRNACNMQARKDSALKRNAVVLSLSQALETPDGKEWDRMSSLDFTEQDILCGEQPDIQEKLEEEEAVLRLKRIMSRRLPEEERDVFERSLNGQNQGQIARDIGCSQAKVSSTLRMARLRILYEAKKEGLLS